MTAKTTTTYAELLASVDAIIDRCDDLPEATRDTEALLRTMLAEHLAQAANILRAFAADETPAIPNGEDILNAIHNGFKIGGKDEWDAPEFQRAREFTAEAGCVWDFTGWHDAAACIRDKGMLGGVQLA